MPDEAFGNLSVETVPTVCITSFPTKLIFCDADNARGDDDGCDHGDIAVLLWRPRTVHCVVLWRAAPLPRLIARGTVLSNVAYSMTIM